MHSCCTDVIISIPGFLWMMAGERNLRWRNKNVGCKLLELNPCSAPSRSDLLELLKPIDHTSPSWLALLAPCHILVGLRNSLFLFELIRTKKKKGFSAWDLGKSRRGGMLTWTAELHFPKPFSDFFFFLVNRRPPILGVFSFTLSKSVFSLVKGQINIYRFSLAC